MTETRTSPPALPSYPSPHPDPGHPTAADAQLQRLEEVIHHAAHLLPAQGPITVFVHHNTLHAFEDLPFTEAVELGSRVFGCRAYLTEDRYRHELQRGRIRVEDLQQVLREDLGADADEPVLDFGTRLEFRLAMLLDPIRQGPAEELAWFVAETDALRRVRPEASAAMRARLVAETRRWVMRDLRGGNEALRGRPAARVTPSAGTEPPTANGLATLVGRLQDTPLEDWTSRQWESFTLQALWQVCRDGVRRAGLADPPRPLPRRHRDLLLAATGADADGLVHELLIRFCAAYLDQGFAHWHLPHRDRGFLNAFCDLYRQPAGPPDRWLRGLPAALARLQDSGQPALASVRDSLAELGVPEPEWQSFLSATLLALRGWGGMVQQVEERGDRVAHAVPRGSLQDFLAVRLLLDRLALAHVAREARGYAGPLAGLRSELARELEEQRPPAGPEERAFTVFQLAQVRDWSPETLHRLDASGWRKLLREIESFSDLPRQKIFHLAYERRFRDQALDAVTLHARRDVPPRQTHRFQAVFCIDEREESFRRHLEEIAPDVETFAAAGFFSVAMYYRGAADAHFVPLCPVVIRPNTWVVEQVEDKVEEEHRRRALARQVLGQASHRLHVGSRSPALGALLATALGPLASIPLVARILFPRLTARVRKTFGRVVQTPPLTRLQLERREDPPGEANGHVGFRLEEMAAVAERLLRDMGLIAGFARLVVIVGHGSHSLNNPHNSAYNCGACGGAAGGPNARAVAWVLNDPRVRALLAARGLSIPDDTVFLGAYHNTCNDEVTYYDLDRLSGTHDNDFRAARRDLDETCERNAHERCRRFMSAPLTLTFAEARDHVEARAEDLAQTRPECGHATNALCVVGQRQWTRGLYLDRRAFLVSYDPAQDGPGAPILTRILQAAVPVCAGINLEYYFSYVDSPGYGCGTKLPHNITSLLGVMDGAASDLRTGLPWQMVEIHEPVRLLFIIQARPEVMRGILLANPAIGRLCDNRWVQLAVFEPEAGKTWVYQNGELQDYRPHAGHLPCARSSVDWYRGWRDHLEFAIIEPAS